MTEGSFEADTDAGTIAGRTVGSGPALLFLHGGPGLTDYGRLLAGEAAGWRLISFQQRGLSPSATGGPFTVEQNVADALAVLDAHEIDRAVVAGHSFGGFLALQLAVLHPDRVRGMVLIDGLGAIGDGGTAEMSAALLGRLLPDAAPRLQALAGQMSDGGPTDDQATEQLRLLWPGYFADPPSAPPPPADMRVSARVNNATFGSARAHLEAGFSGRLGAITVPVVSVLGEQSPMPVSQGEQTAALIPGAEVRVMQAAGHLPWIERPGCVAEALATVLARADGADTLAG
jgi:pimeloyl-ACP methyl ester carboxylesterase